VVVARRRDPEPIARDDRWLHRSLTELGDVTARPHRFGGSAYRAGVRELGHTHLDGRYDIHFDRRTRDLLVDRGIAQPDVYAPNSGWVTVPPGFDELALRLFRLARRRALRSTRSGNSQKTEHWAAAPDSAFCLCEGPRPMPGQRSAYGHMERSGLLTGVSWRPSAGPDIDTPVGVVGQATVRERSGCGMMAPDEDRGTQGSCVRLLARILFAVYLIILAWLILFKFSIHIAAVLHYDKRSLNFDPFSRASGSAGESVDNVLVFIPFGLLLSVNFKGLRFWSKLLVVLGVSITAETIQYLFAIGATDITDVITNTLGGLIGIVGYDISSKYVDRERLDGFIVVAGSVVLGLCVLLLIVVEVRHGVRYHRHGQPS
jgi:glycopeptide antibiotics resistance protein